MKHTLKIQNQDKTIKAICNHINLVYNNNSNLKDFKLSWFGGEPLLYYDTTVKPILEFAYNIFNNTNINFYSTFTTNGLLINGDRINDFKKYNVNFLQITLDGFEEEHNRVRYIFLRVIFDPEFYQMNPPIRAERHRKNVGSSVE